MNSWNATMFWWWPETTRALHSPWPDASIGGKVKPGPPNRYGREQNTTSRYEWLQLTIISSIYIIVILYLYAFLFFSRSFLMILDSLPSLPHLNSKVQWSNVKALRLLSWPDPPPTVAPKPDCEHNWHWRHPWRIRSERIWTYGDSLNQKEYQNV